jgi:hypothetical protein
VPIARHRGLGRFKRHRVVDAHRLMERVFDAIFQLCVAAPFRPQIAHLAAAARLDRNKCSMTYPRRGLDARVPRGMPYSR